MQSAVGGCRLMITTSQARSSWAGRRNVTLGHTYTLPGPRIPDFLPKDCRSMPKTIRCYANRHPPDLSEEEIFHVGLAKQRSPSQACHQDLGSSSTTPMSCLVKTAPISIL